MPRVQNVEAPIAEGHCLAAIAPQSSYLPSTPRPLHRLADLLHLAGGAHHVTYAEAADLEDVLARLLGAEA